MCFRSSKKSPARGSSFAAVLMTVKLFCCVFSVAELTVLFLPAHWGSHICGSVSTRPVLAAMACFAIASHVRDLVFDDAYIGRARVSPAWCSFPLLALLCVSEPAVVRVASAAASAASLRASGNGAVLEVAFGALLATLCFVASGMPLRLVLCGSGLRRAWLQRELVALHVSVQQMVEFLCFVALAQEAGLRGSLAVLDAVGGGSLRVQKAALSLRGAVAILGDLWREA